MQLKLFHLQHETNSPTLYTTQPRVSRAVFWRDTCQVPSQLLISTSATLGHIFTLETLRSHKKEHCNTYACATTITIFLSLLNNRNVKAYISYGYNIYYQVESILISKSIAD